MKSEWLVRHCPVNPKGNEEEIFSNKASAIADLKKYDGDEGEVGSDFGASYLYRDGELIAEKKWNERKVSWKIQLYRKIFR